MKICKGPYLPCQSHHALLMLIQAYIKMQTTPDHLNQHYQMLLNFASYLDRLQHEKIEAVQDVTRAERYFLYSFLQ